MKSGKSKSRNENGWKRLETCEPKQTVLQREPGKERKIGWRVKNLGVEAKTCGSNTTVYQRNMRDRGEKRETGRIVENLKVKAKTSGNVWKRANLNRQCTVRGRPWKEIGWRAENLRVEAKAGRCTEVCMSLRKEGHREMVERKQWKMKKSHQRHTPRDDPRRKFAFRRWTVPGRRNAIESLLKPFVFES